MDSDLGRLRKTLNEKCEFCNSPMQLRVRTKTEPVRGVDTEFEEEYKICSKCGEEVEIRFRDNKKRVTRFDKTAYVKPIEEKRGDNRGYNKSTRPREDNATTSRRSFRPNYSGSNKNI